MAGSMKTFTSLASNLSHYIHPHAKWFKRLVAFTNI